MVRDIKPEAREGQAGRPGVWTCEHEAQNTSFSGPERSAGGRAEIQNIEPKPLALIEQNPQLSPSPLIVGFELNGIDLDLSDAYAGVARFIGNRASTQRQMDRGSAWRTFTIAITRDNKKSSECEIIASSANRSVRFVFIRQDRPEQNPTLAVELHHLELLVDAPIIRCG